MFICRPFKIQFIIIIAINELYSSLASNLKQAANLCAQANSASYPQRDRKWVVAHGLRGEGLVR